MLKLLILVLLSVPAFGAYTEFYLATTGDNRNAGSTTSDAASVTSTNGDWTSPTFTAASGTPFSGVSAGEWACISLDADTACPFFARITSVGGAGASITVTTTNACGTAPANSATGRSARVGGRWATPGHAFSTMCADAMNSSGHAARLNVVSGTIYSITSQISIVFTGQEAFTIQGYTTTPGDGGRPTIQGPASGASFNLLNMALSKGVILRDLIFQRNGSTGNADCVTAGGSARATLFYNILVHDCRGAGIRLDYYSVCYLCEVHTANTSNSANKGGVELSYSSLIRSFIHDITGSNGDCVVAPHYSSYGVIDRSVISDCGGHGIRLRTQSANLVSHSIIDDAAGDGIHTESGVVANADSQNNIIIGNVITNNSGYGVGYTTDNDEDITVMYGNYFWSNTSGQTEYTHAVGIESNTALSGNPWADSANGDFTPSAELANTAQYTLPDSTLSGTTISYEEAGAIQRQAAAGGGNVITQNAVSF